MILHDGLKRKFQLNDKVFYYVTVMNENYTHPAKPKGSDEGIIKGIYCLQEGGKKGNKVQLMGSGAILREVIAAADLLKADFDVDADVWSVTSVNELAREANDCNRWNVLHPGKKARISYLELQLRDRKGPAVMATDYTRAFVDQLRGFVPMRFVTLGTDGFGRSDTRKNLRIFFEVNRYYIVVTALKALSDEGDIDLNLVKKAIKKYNIDVEKPNPMGV